eukprot:CAMPEP_0171253280 /NCGR_PEP_ID=MMETSP0790-20130122/51621_1 /TAXON_ID=2925 /ORGANISM="Alexandrium catenella, Strain OF101" /LENGTH=367 /DNA_ID=CAMNT_0011721099 /DNA_START=49 /DNA_END=1154 /DNA_ORIENTATION=-
MVSASKVAALRSQQGLGEFSDGGIETHDTTSLEQAIAESSVGSAEVAYVPLSFGEQLVLETYIRCRQRPYDRKRQEELAAPRHRGATGDPPVGAGEPGTSQSSSAQPSKTLPKNQVEELCSRLAQPKRFLGSKTSPGEDLAQQSSEEDRAKRACYALETDSAQVAARALSDAWRAVVMAFKEASAGRPVDLERVAELAKPTKRGASLRSWGVRPDWVRPEQPASARGHLSSRSSEQTQRRPGAAAALSPMGSAFGEAASSQAYPTPPSSGGAAAAFDSPGSRSPEGALDSLDATRRSQDGSLAATPSNTGGKISSRGTLTPDINTPRQAPRPTSFLQHGARGGLLEAEDVDDMRQAEGRRTGVDRHA